MTNATLTTLRLITFSQGVPLLGAQQGGFLNAEGLAIDWTRARSSTAQIQAMLNGEVDIIHTAVDNVMAYHDRGGAGTDLFVFFVGELSIEQVLTVRREITSVEQLRGQLLGVDALDTGYAVVLRSMLARRGLPEGSYRLESVGGTIERFNALKEGRIAGCMLQEPIEDPSMHVLARAIDDYPTYPSLTAVTTHAWANAHEDLLQRYTRALVRGTRWALAPENRATMARLLAEEAGVSPALMEARLAASRGIPSVADAESGIALVRRIRDEVMGRPERTATTDEPRAWDLSYEVRALADAERAPA